MDIIEQHLRIPKAEAAVLLRRLLESNQIRNVVVGWELIGARRGWVAQGYPSDPHHYCVWGSGWDKVNWDDGTLAGCEILVQWIDVERELATLSATSRNRSEAELKESEKRDREELTVEFDRLPEELKTQPKARDAFAELWRYALKEKAAGRLAKRDLAAKHVEDRTSYPVRRARYLYRCLPDALRYPPRARIP